MRSPAPLGFLLSLVLVAGLPGCRSPGRPEGGAVLEVLEGKVRAGAGALEPVSGWVAVPPGWVVEASPGAWAVLEFASARLELGPGTRVQVGRGEVRLARGMVLAEAARPFRVEGPEAVATGRGVFRMDVGVGTRVGSYSGEVGALAEGGEVVVRAYWQAAATAGRVLQPEPYRLRASDRWDRKYLGPALEAGPELESLARGFDSRVGRLGLAAIVAAAPQALKDLAFGFDGLPSELVIAGVIASLTKGDPRSSFSQALSFRRAGASWGLVVQASGVDPEKAVREVASIMASWGRTLAAPPPSSGGPSVGRSGAGRGRTGEAGGGSRAGGEGGSSPAASGEGGQAGGGSGAGGGGGAPSPGPSPAPGLLEDLVGEVLGAVGGLLGGAPSPSPSPGG